MPGKSMAGRLLNEFRVGSAGVSAMTFLEKHAVYPQIRYRIEYDEEGTGTGGVVQK